MKPKYKIGDYVKCPYFDETILIRIIAVDIYRSYYVVEGVNKHMPRVEWSRGWLDGTASQKLRKTVWLVRRYEAKV